MSMSHVALRSRRDLLRVGAGALLSAGLWPGSLRAADNGKGGDFTFVTFNDTHFHTERCPGWFAKVNASIRALEPRPEFCLILGDLGEKGRQSELGGMRDALRDLGIDYYTVIGNHDWTEPTDRSVYEQLFPGRINYHFEHRDWQFIGLDSTEGDKYSRSSVQADTFAWLDANLARFDRALPTVLFTHFPLGDGVMMRPANADDLLGRLRDLNLVTICNGHFHGFTERTFDKATITTNRCCAISRDNHDGTKEKGYFVYSARSGALERRFVEVVA
ncbi:MAG: metallophosphoesterase [Gammaproteobacteria bacterium]|nr:metallophosphoesterase [Gammaproteobacteria bacterium]